jgi:hypothetical protein
MIDFNAKAAAYRVARQHAEDCLAASVAAEREHQRLREITSLAWIAARELRDSMFAAMDEDIVRGEMVRLDADAG